MDVGNGGILGAIIRREFGARRVGKNRHTRVGKKADEKLRKIQFSGQQ